MIDEEKIFWIENGRPNIKLNDYEIGVASREAEKSLKRVNDRGYKNLTVPKDHLKTNCDGVKAEFAWFKIFGFSCEGWGDESAWKQRKCGDFFGVEIRSTTYATGRLLLRPRDDKNRPYVLIRSHKDPVFEVVGWIFGYEGMRPEFEQDKGHSISSIYMVPTEMLRDPSEIIYMVNEKIKSGELSQ